MTQALACFKRVCEAIGRAAVKLAENVDARIEFELTRRRPLTLPIERMANIPTEQPTDMPSEQTCRPSMQPKDMPSKQSIEQPNKQSIEQPSEQSIEQPKRQSIEPPTDMPTEQPTDMPTGQPMEQTTGKLTNKLKEHSIDMNYGKVKPNLSEMATLEGAHSVFKDIVLKSGYMQSKRTSVATSRWRRTRTSFGSMLTHRSI